MLRGTKYLVASPNIIARINEIKGRVEEEEAKAEEERKTKIAKAEERESTIMCLDEGNGDNNIMCE